MDFHSPDRHTGMTNHARSGPAGFARVCAARTFREATRIYNTRPEASTPWRHCERTYLARRRAQSTGDGCACELRTKVRQAPATGAGYLVRLHRRADRARHRRHGTLVNEFKLPGSDTQRATDLLKAKFPAQNGSSLTFVFQAKPGEKITSPSATRPRSRRSSRSPRRRSTRRARRAPSTRGTSRTPSASGSSTRPSPSRASICHGRRPRR